MSYHKNILLAFKLHYNRFKASNQILVRLSPRISVAKLGLVPSSKFFRVFCLNFLISHFLANSRINFIQSLPPLLRSVDPTSSLNRSLQPRGPHAKVRNVLFRDIIRERFAIDSSTRGEVRVSSNATLLVKVRLSMLWIRSILFYEKGHWTLSKKNPNLPESNRWFVE